MSGRTGLHRSLLALRDRGERFATATDRGIAPVRVRDVMSTRLTTVRPETPLRDVQRAFTLREVDALPVVDSAGALRGLVTRLDLLRVFRSDPSRLRPRLSELFAETAGDIMRRGVGTLEPDEPVTAAVDLMVSSDVRSVPIVERRGGTETLVGIVTRGNVIPFLVFGDAAEVHPAAA